MRSMSPTPARRQPAPAADPARPAGSARSTRLIMGILIGLGAAVAALTGVAAVLLDEDLALTEATGQARNGPLGAMLLMLLAAAPALASGIVAGAAAGFGRRAIGERTAIAGAGLALPPFGGLLAAIVAGLASPRLALPWSADGDRMLLAAVLLALGAAGIGLVVACIIAAAVRWGSLRILAREQREQRGQRQRPPAR